MGPDRRVTATLVEAGIIRRLDTAAMMAR